MSETSELEEEVGILIAAKDAALAPFQFATSKTARRAYLGSALLFFTGLTLLGFAITAYLFFYYAYIPERGFSKPVYLQFDGGQHAFADIDLGNRLVSDQPYDIQINLHLPRTPSNIAVGNFMVQLELVTQQTQWTAEEKPTVLARERRPAILTYYSPAMEHVQNVMRLPLHMTGFRKESEFLDVALMDGIAFGRGRRNVPSLARVELQSAAPLQVYDTSITFRTKLRGLRYLMYNWRITTFIVLTSIFWAVELSIAGLFWIMLPVLLAGAGPSNKGADNQDAIVKQEVDSTFDTTVDTGAEATPTSIKKEEPTDLVALETYPVAAEADIEDEGEDDNTVVVEEMYGAAPSDSGIGTSMESSNRRETIRRRMSKNL